MSNDPLKELGDGIAKDKWLMIEDALTRAFQLSAVPGNMLADIELRMRERGGIDAQTRTEALGTFMGVCHVMPKVIRMVTHSLSGGVLEEHRD